MLLPFILLLTAPAIELLIQLNKLLVFPESWASMEAWMQKQEANAEILLQTFMRMDGMWELTLNLFMIALIPALGEELLFRGVIQRLMAKWSQNPHIGILVAAILFSAMHMQFYGFMPRLALGALFGYLFLWSGTLWIPIFAHMLFNGTQVVLAYTGHIDVEDLSNGLTEATPIYITVGAVILLIALLFVYRRLSNYESEYS